jgi:site-specific DNA-methyltransferase (adenine-specific)
MSQEIDWMNPKGQHYFNMDCMEGMKMMPDKCMDLAIVDPPYGIGVNSMNMGSRNTVKPTGKQWDSMPPPPEYFQELFRVSRNQIIWGGNYFDLPPSQYFAIWDKGETMYGRDFAECEFAWARSGGTRIFKTSPNQLDRFHPTQKPMALYRWLVKNYAKQGDLILDTHVGSASSLVVYEEMGFEYVGYELDADYYRDSCKRLEAFRAQPKLFTGKEIFEASKPPELF